MDSSPSASRQEWIGDEPRMPAVVRAVVARALRRPRRVLVIVLVATAGAVAYRALKAPSYKGTVYFRIAEGDVTDPNNAPRPPHAISEYISNVVLSRFQLERIMKKYGWSAVWLARDRVAAIDAFGEEIAIEVRRNYFIYNRQPGDPPRSAEVAISLAGPDDEQIRGTLHDVGATVLRAQTSDRTTHVAEARGVMARELGRARARGRSLQQMIDGLSLDAVVADPNRALALRTQIAELQADESSATTQLLALERRASDLAVSAAAEDEQLGLKLELFDESVVPLSPRLTRYQLARFALLALAIAFLVTAPVVGAFDDRVDTIEDLRRHQLPLFGALPTFPGDEAGSYRRRTLTNRA